MLYKHQMKSIGRFLEIPWTSFDCGAAKDNLPPCEVREGFCWFILGLPGNKAGNFSAAVSLCQEAVRSCILSAIPFITKMSNKLLCNT